MANTLTFTGQTLTDANIFGGITYTVDLNTGTEFSIGNTASASVTFTTDTQVPLYSKDSTNGTFTWTQNSTVRGRFYITEVTKTETGYFTVTAYDAMILLDALVSALSISYPATVSGLASQIATYLGCTVSGTVNNGTLSVSELDETKTIRQLLGWIAEASAASVKIDGSDHLCFMYYASSGITVSDSDYKKLKVADYTCAAIDNVTIMGIDGQPCASSGAGTNTLYIQGNPFLYEATNTVAATILGIVDDYAYTPIECDMFDRNGLEVGTIATFGTTASLVMHIEEQTEEGVKVSSVGSDTRAELNKSVEVLVEQLDATVATMNQHFWYTASGAEAGAHIAEVDKATFETTPAGGNLLSNSQGVKVRKGLDVLAEMTADGFAAMTDGVAVFEAASSGASENATIYQKIQGITPSPATVVTLPIPENVGAVNGISLGYVNLTYGTSSSGSASSHVSYVYDGDRTLTLTADSGSRSIDLYISLTFTAPYFTLGVRSGEPAPYSTAIGKSVIASDNSQTAIGKYNEEDTGAFLIGNGSDDSNRSNALKVDWSGNVTAAGDIEDGSGNVLSTVASKVSRTTQRKTWSQVHAASSTGVYVELVSFTIPAGHWVIMLANGNGLGAAVMCNINAYISSGTGTIYGGLGTSNDSSGNYATGWGYIEATTSVTVKVRTYTYNTSVTNFNGYAVVTPAL
jgi:hypothetical protein